MAERRMFAKTIVLSDSFLDMPLGARCLYMTMGMLADDDGFVNAPKSIMRQTGATDDDLRVLIAKKFVIPFESGVIVIKHWRINNYLQKDRIQPTKYQDEFGTLEIEKNGAYTERQQIPVLGESVVKDQKPNGFDEFWKVYPKKASKGAAEKAFAKAIKEVSLEEMITAVKKQMTTKQWIRDGGQYIPYPSTWLNQKRWLDEVTATEPKPVTVQNSYTRGERLF